MRDKVPVATAGARAAQLNRYADADLASSPDQ